MAPETERANDKSKRLTFYERPGNDLLEILFMGPLIAQCCFDARRLNVFHFLALSSFLLLRLHSSPRVAFNTLS